MWEKKFEYSFLKNNLNIHIGTMIAPRLIRAMLVFLIDFAVENIDSAPAGSRNLVCCLTRLFLLTAVFFVLVIVVAAEAVLVLLDLEETFSVSVVVVVAAAAAVDARCGRWDLTFGDNVFIFPHP